MLRTVDVSLGTLRTISIIQGRLTASFFLGLVEVSIWLTIISATLQYISQNPMIGIFYALGFSTGNVVGIFLERKVPIGNVTMRLFVKEKDLDLVEKLREKGFSITKFSGEGHSGAVYLLFCFTQKKRLPEFLAEIQSRDEVFYTVDYGGYGAKILAPTPTQPTGWRNKLKFK
ncbi:DUF2179 domain-containing protein [Chloroherpeton thalassium]|nr:DUF5698 domain-containing protein [Chloroherpeton thalassium]